MNTRVARLCTIISSFLLASLPTVAAAQEEDVQLWVYAVARGEIGDGTRLVIDGTLRFREQARGDEQQTLRFAITQDVAEGVRLGGGGGIFETEGGGTELRPHQEIDLSFGRFSARTRLEQRFFDGADRMELRARQLVRYTQPLSAKVRVSVDGEYLGLLQTRERGSNAPRDQWRARAIASVDVAERLTLGAGYMMIFVPRTGQPDRITHVPEAYLTWRF